MSFHDFLPKKRTTPRRRPRSRVGAVERLEERNLLTATPFGASAEDTGEFMLGDVYVTVVAFESDGSRDPNLEDWNDAYRNQLKSNIQEGLNWWEDTLDISFPNHQHELNFQIDFTFLDSPIATSYEPISRPSFDFQLWTADFFDAVDFDNGDFSTNSRAFNHAQREIHETDWAFTIFVVNDESDSDGRFEPGGFDRAFAFSGGRFFITPAGRPDSTFAHETGHMFWARDEYRGGGNFADTRGYYDAHNHNAWDNPLFLNGQAEREPSIMDRGACDENGGLLCAAYQDHSSSGSSFAMIGWTDSDGDGIFDVLDVPLTLEGIGHYDAAQSEYHFQGSSSVATLPNLNSSGEQNDITINHVSQAQFRIDGGVWQEAQRFDDFTASLNFAVPMAVGQQIEIRTIDDATGMTSPIFLGTTDQPASTLLPGINGFVWDDDNEDGVWDSAESGSANRTVQLVDQNGDPLILARGIEPDDYPSQSTLLNDVIPEVSLTGIGFGTFDDSVVSVASPASASTGTRVFANFCGSFCAEWTKESRQLRMDFAAPVTTVSIDAIAKNDNDLGRLEIYDANDKLLARYTTSSLAAGEVETMTLNRPIPEIAYAIAGAHTDRTILLDNLRFGPQTSDVTDSNGAYQLPYLEVDTYTVQLLANTGSHPTAPSSGEQSISLSVGQAIGDVNFGVTGGGNPWQNPNNRFDVNDDGFVTPNDVLLIVNNLNARGPHTLVDEPTPPFRDVNGDGLVTSNDVLQVINEINSRAGSEGESGPSRVLLTPGSESAIPEAEASAAASSRRDDGSPVLHVETSRDREQPMHASPRQLTDVTPFGRRQLGWNFVADVNRDSAVLSLPIAANSHGENRLTVDDLIKQRTFEEIDSFLASELDDALIDQLAADQLAANPFGEIAN